MEYGLAVRCGAAAETEAWGFRLGGRLEAGDCIALQGGLGAGKTTMIKGIARGIGYDPSAVTSPTFTLLHISPARLPIYHFDLYRLDSAEEILTLGFDECLDGDGVTVIEWAEKIAGLLPPDHLLVDIRWTGQAERLILFRPHGTKPRRRLAKMQA